MDPTTTGVAQQVAASNYFCDLGLSESLYATRTAPHETRGAGLVLEPAAGTSYHGSTPKERGDSLAQRSSMDMTRPQPARHGVCTLEARVLRLLPRDTERRHACTMRRARHAAAGLALESAAGTSRHDLAPKERDLSPAQRLLNGRRKWTIIRAAWLPGVTSLKSALLPDWKSAEICFEMLCGRRAASGGGGHWQLAALVPSEKLHCMNLRHRPPARPECHRPHARAPLSSAYGRLGRASNAKPAP